MDVQIIKIVLAFMVLINPFSALGLFLDITQGYSDNDRRKVARITCVTVFVAIAFFAIFGEMLLAGLGISIASFRVAGGILVFLIAINMMNGGGNPAKPNEREVGVKSSMAASAVVPLAIPMIVGPGGISTVIIYASQIEGLFALSMIVVAGLFISLICYLSLMAAAKISRFLGDTGLNILSRVMGMLLAAVAVEIMVSGLKVLAPTIFS